MIKLIKSFSYDNNYDYIKTFSNQDQQLTFFNTLLSFQIDSHNYVKEHESFKVKISYDELVEEGVNYIIFNNGFRNVYAFITSKEYLNEEVTRINFEIDVFQTYMFDFNIKESFIERKVCTINEITDFDEGIDFGEHIIEYDNIVIEKNSHFFAFFSGFKNHYIGNEGTTLQEFSLMGDSRYTTKIDGIEYPLLFYALDSEESILNFSKHLYNLPNLQGIIRFPNCSYTKKTVYLPFVKVVDGKMISSGIGTSDAVDIITSKVIAGSGTSVAKSNITDFYPYTYYLITDGESEPLLLEPQYLSDSFTVNGQFALSHTPVERYFPSYYKGSSNGKIYNITNTSNMLLPVATNGGLETITSNMNTLNSEYKSSITNAVLGVATTVGSALTGNAFGVAMGVQGIANTISSYNSVQNTISRRKDLLLTPNSIKSYGTPSTRNKFNTNNVRVVKYTIEDKYKTKINNFIKRYGNKFNNFDTIDIKNYKGYIKYISPNIDSSIDNIYINKIISILERGVFIE